MTLTRRFYHQAMAYLAGRWPALADRLVASFQPRESSDQIPWTAVTTPLNQANIAVVTTAGLHHRHQRPFDMNDPQGDPTFRLLDAGTIENDFVITHDYYDHRDAEKDLNIVFPIARLREMRAAGLIGALARTHLSFMGHIDGPHVQTLLEKSAPQAAEWLRAEKVDIVLLTPA